MLYALRQGDLMRRLVLKINAQLMKIVTVYYYVLSDSEHIKKPVFHAI